MSQLTLFNKNIEETIKYLIKVAEKTRDDAKDKDTAMQTKLSADLIQLRLAEEKFQLAKSYNPQMILLNFFQYVYPFKQNIMQKNERFFLDEDIKKHIQDEKIKKTGVDEQYILTKSLDIKNYWKLLTDAQKNQVWQYFQNMVGCCEKYVMQNVK